MNIPLELYLIKLALERIENDVKGTPQVADLLAQLTLLLNRDLTVINGQLENQEVQLTQFGIQLGQLVKLLTPLPAVNAVGSVIARNPQPSAEEMDNDMALKFKGRKFSGKPATRKAGADVEIQADGTALYTATALDADGNPTAWPTGAALSAPVVTDPSTVPGGPYYGVALNTADATGASLIGTPQNVKPAPAGALPDVGIGVSATVTFPGVAPFSITFPLVDVIAGPAGSAAGTVISNNPAT